MLKNIVLVEDDAAIAEPLSYVLQKEGWQVHWFTTGMTAIDHIQQHLFDFIILDVGLPDINGFDLCRKIRLQTDKPLLFLTARNEEIERIIGLEIGADDYCTKPFSPRELVSRIKVIWRRYEKSITPSVSLVNSNNQLEQADIQLTNWHYHAARQQVFYRQQLLKLTPIELRILLVFLTGPNRIYSREMLMQQAWEHPDHSLIRTVDSHIKSLRQKIKQITVDEVIITHRSFGYEMKN